MWIRSQKNPINNDVTMINADNISSIKLTGDEGNYEIVATTVSCDVITVANFTKESRAIIAFNEIHDMLKDKTIDLEHTVINMSEYEEKEPW